MKKLIYLIASLFTALIILIIYWLYFSPSARKSDYVYKNYQKIQLGMARSQVVSLLTEPDTIYQYNNFVTVLSYSMGFGAPDDVRVYIVNDTVAGTSYNQ